MITEADFVLPDGYRTKDSFFIDSFPSFGELVNKTEAGCSESKNLIEALYPKDLCSIVVPVFNRLDLTRDCFDKIRSTCRDIDYEIILIDNGSSYEIEEFSHMCNVVYYRFEKNVGIPMALNMGSRLAKGQFLTFMHNDFMVHKPGWLRDIICKLKLTPTAGAIGFCAMQQAPRTGPLKGKKIQCLDGMSMTFSRSIFEEIGGFDESFDLIGYYDIDICYKLAQAGYKTLVSWTPCSHLNHGTSASKSFEESSGKSWFEVVHENKQKFMQKWGLEEDFNKCEECHKPVFMIEKLRPDICFICRNCYYKLKRNSIRS